MCLRARIRRRHHGVAALARHRGGAKEQNAPGFEALGFPGKSAIQTGDATCAKCCVPRRARRSSGDEGGAPVPTSDVPRLGRGSIHERQCLSTRDGLKRLRDVRGLAREELIDVGHWTLAGFWEKQKKHERLDGWRDFYSLMRSHRISRMICVYSFHPVSVGQGLSSQMFIYTLCYITRHSTGYLLVSLTQRLFSFSSLRPSQIVAPSQTSDFVLCPFIARRNRQHSQHQSRSLEDFFLFSFFDEEKTRRFQLSSLPIPVSK